MAMLTVFQSRGTGRRTKKSIAEAMAPAPFYVSSLGYLHADPWRSWCEEVKLQLKNKVYSRTNLDSPNFSFKIAL